MLSRGFGPRACELISTGGELFSMPMTQPITSSLNIASSELNKAISCWVTKFSIDGLPCVACLEFGSAAFLDHYPAVLLRAMAMVLLHVALRLSAPTSLQQVQSAGSGRTIELDQAVQRLQLNHGGWT